MDFQNYIIQFHDQNEFFYFSLSRTSEILYNNIQMNKKDRFLEKIISKHLPSKKDQFRDDSGDENIQPKIDRKDTLSRKQETQIERQADKHRKQIKKAKKPIVIQIDSENDNIKEENIERVSQKNKKQDELVQQLIFGQLDQEQIQYYKRKLNIKQQYTQNIQKQQQKQETKKYIPPPDVVKVPKFIHEYPPYPLGPTDTWPPKYPNSWRSFKQDMKDNRKLQ